MYQFVSMMTGIRYYTRHNMERPKRWLQNHIVHTYDTNNFTFLICGKNSPEGGQSLLLLLCWGQEFYTSIHLQAGNSVGKAKITPVPYLLGLLPLLYPCNYMLETNLHAAWVLIMYLKMVKFGWR